MAAFDFQGSKKARCGRILAERLAVNKPNWLFAWRGVRISSW